MLKKIIITILLFSGFNYAGAQLPVGILLPVPDALRKNAHSVIREETEVFEIKSIDKAYYRVHELITVLDENDKNKLNFFLDADKFHSLENVSLVIYNSAGEKIKKYDKKDLFVVNNIGEGLVSDGKYYYTTTPVINSYPAHMLLDYEIKFNGLLHYPSYQVQAEEQSVEKSSFTVIVPVDLDIRYKEKNVKLAPLVSSDKSNKIYNWSVTNMPALRYESESVSPESRYPRDPAGTQ